MQCKTGNCVLGIGNGIGCKSILRRAGGYTQHWDSSSHRRTGKGAEELKDDPRLSQLEQVLSQRGHQAAPAGPEAVEQERAAPFIVLG